MPRARFSRTSHNLQGALFEWLIAFFILVTVGYSVYRYFTDRSNYNQGHQAYRNVACIKAIGYFDRVINAWRLLDIGKYTALSQQEKLECLAYQAASDKHQAEDFSAALASYGDFVSNYGDSLLVNAVRNKLKSLFKQTQPATLASQDSCKQIDTLYMRNLIPQPTVNLPPFYFTCGRMYQNLRDNTNAIDMYEAFLTKYPDHPFASQVNAALARSIVAKAKEESAGNLPMPNIIGSTGSNSVVVNIRNDSPERLRIAFSGPEAAVVELKPCSSCTQYSGLAPVSCPNNVPVGRYTLKPGTYDVVVEAIEKSRTTPYKGAWNLSSGIQYDNCFFIVTRF